MFRISKTFCFSAKTAAVIASLMIIHCAEESDDSKSTDDSDAADSSSDTEADAGTTEDTETDSDDVQDVVALWVDDFEDGDNISLIGGFWYTYDDSAGNGLSSLDITVDDEGYAVMDGEGYESERGMALSYALDQGEWEYDPYVGWGVTMGEESALFDASIYSGITYAYKGSAHTIRMETVEVTNYDFYHVKVPDSADWTVLELPFSDFGQEGWEGVTVDFNLNNLIKISWQIQSISGDTGAITMDNIGLLSTGAIEKVPDLTINEPNPPADETIDSIDIENPLQALALSALNKGYNLTNWLEEAKFESYEFDEQYVNDLASNGFKALRLPIDLDLYIDNREEYFAGNANFAVESLLFEILDNFEQWTAAAGMSLTIDYHQYDASFDMTDSLYMDAVIQLWTSVAEHFSDNPREDLFFEMMNEPELAGGVDSVSQSDWTDFATQIIAGIRSVDTSHAIIFGDVSWNGISPLTNRTPFEDEKMIYVFHFYEPFIFTHQGTSWTGMGSTRDIPYPYSKERWSEYSSDFGFTSSQEDWQFSALQQYYQTGNKSWMRNQIIDAKRWAVENDVPVICNEFGAYDGSSQEEDRLRYYTDIVDIFEELEISWQHWFMIMNESGEVDADLKAAFGLK